ncbi:MAG: hypothetical protein JWM81_533 [Candidatus Saccharibacteria bacterium]|nr:hypothetical protein [Candidatus Saccharibacteria bacterium]
MDKKTIGFVVQLGFGLVALGAVVRQLVRCLNAGFGAVNFFSYFTSLASIFAALVLLYGAANVYNHKRATRQYELLRGSSVLCVTVVLLIFGFILRDRGGGMLLPWVDIMLHYVLPVIAITHWFLYPPTIKITVKQALPWLAFPAVFLVYSIIRGAMTSWYAYSYIDPSQPGGYVRVILYCVALLLLFTILSRVLLTARRPKVEA